MAKNGVISSAHVIHTKLKHKVDMTVEVLSAEVRQLYPVFTLSSTTLRKFMHRLRFSYRINKDQRQIFGKLDLVRKRRSYLVEIAYAREQEHCIVSMKETWIFEFSP
ncbi:hypothetical protein Y032_0179g702 [Ancylostoma ceylanicum]|uniref:Winged helix-turn helix domain-containing protein n=1 Tax=Ancylostoma ceylanicum TaxID=53326 RepID=A0A016STG6_9BILA|nr:hypothetical protein Y032_0179g702 [Ancylostoma ceylanicum]